MTAACPDPVLRLLARLSSQRSPKHTSSSSLLRFSSQDVERAFDTVLDTRHY